uniref:Predicted protein n=1 Tax=Physcomitrium patens TaxID=3218 RepID=A9U4Z3_PHYPA
MRLELAGQPNADPITGTSRERCLRQMDLLKVFEDHGGFFDKDREELASCFGRGKKTENWIFFFFIGLEKNKSKKADMGMEEIIRGMRDLQIKLARLEENTSINNSKNISKQGYVQRCIWCDDASHTRKNCNEFNNMIRQGIIYWKDGKIALKNREDLLQTNFGKGRMKTLVQDYLKEHETAARESASYGARVDDEIGGSTETSEFWASAVSTMQEGKLPREALLRTPATIRSRTGWEDLVESLSVHAYIAKSQHEALMEEKRRGNFDDTREGNSFKRQTRGDKAREAASQELPVKDTSSSLGEKTTETKDKGKSIAYKLLSDIEAATNLKGVLEERILNAKVEFTLKEVLEIAKKEFHNQSTNEKNGYNQRVRFEDSSDKEMETLSHYTWKHWARATTEVLVKVEDIEEPIVTLVDHGSEINLMSKDLYKKQKWPIVMEHGWVIRAANNTRGELYGASTRMETKVLDDGSTYAMVRSEDGRKAVQFLTVPPNHEQNQDRLREKPLPKIVEGFKDFGEVYTMLESFQAPEVTVETRYKTADKKVKPIVRPLPEDSKEQMGEASKEASLRDPMSIGHQFTKETFEELKIGSDGSLLPKEITCFKKMLAKQGDEDELDKDVEDIF